MKEGIIRFYISDYPQDDNSIEMFKNRNPIFNSHF